MSRTGQAHEIEVGSIILDEGEPNRVEAIEVEDDTISVTLEDLNGFPGFLTLKSSDPVKFLGWTEAKWMDARED